MRLFRFAVPAALAVACAAGLALSTASASPRAAAKPSAGYAMTTPCGSGSDCTITVTIRSNPVSYNVRAWLQCSDQSRHFGNWHTRGTTAAGCGSGHGYGTLGGFQYDVNHQYQVTCWVVSDPRTGSC